MPKNVQTSAQSHSSHTLAKQCSKFSKRGFNSTWTENFQMFKWDLEKAEESEIKLPTSVVLLKKQESSRKTSALKRWEYQTTWEICMQVKKQQLELDMEQQTGSKLGKEYVKAVYCLPAYLTYMQSTSWETLGWKKHKLELRLPGEISITSDMQMTPPLWQKVKRNQKTSWWKWERRVEKVGLKLNIQKTKIMACGLITSWQIDGERVETVTDFIFGGSKITADGDHSHEIKRRLLLGRKVMTNLDSILKSRDNFANKSLFSQGYCFSSSHVWMWEMDYKESWASKNWCFWIVVLEKTL